MEVTIPSSVTSIGPVRVAVARRAHLHTYAHAVCARSAARTHPRVAHDRAPISVRSWSVGCAQRAFAGCSSLAEVTIPSSVTSIGEVRVAAARRANVHTHAHGVCARARSGAVLTHCRAPICAVVVGWVCAGGLSWLLEPRGGDDRVVREEHRHRTCGRGPKRPHAHSRRRRLRSFLPRARASDALSSAYLRDRGRLGGRRRPFVVARASRR
jgi:hypothetical protein